MDILFIDFSNTISQKYWHLGFRYMISFLRKNGISAGLQYPAQLILKYNSSPNQISNIINGIKKATAGTKRPVFANHLFAGLADETMKKIIRCQPKLIGFSIYDGRLPDLLKYIRKLKARGSRSRVVLGGHYATFVHEQILTNHPEIDFVVRGEGEKTILELIKCLKGEMELSKVLGLSYRLNGKVQVNPPRPLIEDLDELPPPATDHYRNFSKNEYVPVSSSRGCYGSCSYCSISAFYRLCPHRKIWRAHSPDWFVGHLADLNKRYGIARFNFIDDSFIGGRLNIKRAAAIAAGIIKRKLKIKFAITTRADELDEALLIKLKRAGLNQVFLGIESNFQRGLNTYNKHITVEKNHQALRLLDKLGLRINANLIFFEPYLQAEEIQENLKFVRGLKNNDNANTISPYLDLCILQGTALVNKTKADRLLTGSYLGYGYKYKDQRIRSIHDLLNIMSAAEAIEVLADIIQRADLNFIKADDQLRSRREKLRQVLMAYLQNYVHWYVYVFLAGFLESASRLSERELRYGPQADLLRAMMLEESQRASRVYHTIFRSFLGAPLMDNIYQFNKAGSSFIFLGNNLRLVKINSQVCYPGKNQPLRLKDKFIAGLNDQGLLSSWGDEYRALDDYQERHTLRSLNIEYSDLNLARFEAILDHFNKTFTLAGNYQINIFKAPEHLSKNQKRAIQRIAAHCAANKLRLNLTARGRRGTCSISSEPGHDISSGRKSLYHCPAGTGSFWIKKNGDIYACRLFSKKKALQFGNVYKGQFNELMLKYFTDAYVDKKSLCGGCWAKYLCGGGCPYAAYRTHGSLYRPDQSQCASIKDDCRSELEKYVAAEERG